MVMSDKTYNILADLARIILPAFATFYLALGEIWHLPYSQEISATIMALCALLGAFLKTSSNKYFGKDGHITFINNEDGGDAE